MQNKDQNSALAFQELTKAQKVLYQVETFLSENYEFRRNILSGKTEYRMLSESVEPFQWNSLTKETVNTIVREAKKNGIGGDKSPRQDIEEYINSDATPIHNPVIDYLSRLPKWDGENHVARLWERIPGITTEQTAWLSIWLRSMVAHWKQMDMLHGNECLPILIGAQGCGKSTFAVRLLPPELRVYYMDHINFLNKFDSNMALTNNLLGNLDEFSNMGASQQGKLKQTLSKVKVNARPIFGAAQEDKPRFASFLATTNDEHPLVDPTGSRRYLCIKIPKGMFINNETEINYSQLYAQVLYELEEKQVPYWFTNEQVERIQQVNLPFFKSEDLESMITSFYQVPEEGEECAQWLSCSKVCQELKSAYPTLQTNSSTKIRIGQILRYLGCQTKHSKHGQVYFLTLKAAS